MSERANESAWKAGRQAGRQGARRDKDLDALATAGSVWHCGDEYMAGRERENQSCITSRPDSGTHTYGQNSMD